MWKLLAKLWIKVNGWQVVGSVPDGIDKGVMIAAPHTSNHDLFFSLSAFYILDIPVKFALKKEVIESIVGPIFTSLGAIPIDRSKGSKGKRNSYVDQMVQYLNESDKIMIMIAPEGTRKYVKKWKSGFYYVARGANVPIVLGYLDYKKKHAGIGPVMYMTDDLKADLEKIKAFYRGVTPKYPELTHNPEPLP